MQIENIDDDETTLQRTKIWHDFLELMRAIDIPADFMSERLMNTLPNDHNLLGDKE